MKGLKARSVSWAVRTIVVCGCVLALAAGEGLAAEPDGYGQPGRRPSKKRWIASCLALVAVNVLDVHSSWGHGEANPLFRSSSGRFAVGRATLIKSGITGVFLTSQAVAIRRHPQADYYKAFTVVNTVAAGGLGAVVIHNYSLPKPTQP